jgi:hypothetical protein
MVNAPPKAATDSAPQAATVTQDCCCGRWKYICGAIGLTILDAQRELRFHLLDEHLNVSASRGRAKRFEFQF